MKMLNSVTELTHIGWNMSSSKPDRPRVGHVWVRFKPRIGHIKPRDLAGVIKEETKVSGGKG